MMLTLGCMFSLGLSGAILAGGQADAQLFQRSRDEACRGVTAGGTGCPGNAASAINNIIRTVLNVLSIIVGITAVIMVIIGGLRFIISRGDPSNAASARNTILYAIIGLVIVALAQLIVRFVLNRVT